MPKRLEEQFQEEVARRQGRTKTHSNKKVTSFLLIVGLLLGLFYTINSYSSQSLTEQPVKDVANSSNQLKAVTLPKSGVLKKYLPKPKEQLGRIRIFLRPPLKAEKSSISPTCSYQQNADDTKQKNNYFVEFRDWKTHQVVTSAFIRSGDQIKKGYKPLNLFMEKKQSETT